jgi:hypothetical protein
MRSFSFAEFASLIARRLYLRDASTIFTVIFTVYFVCFMSLTGCGSGGSTSGGVTQSTQTITFTQPASPIVYTPGFTITLAATGGGSGNPVVFTVDTSSTGRGAVSGNTLTVTGAGRLVIDANQAGNSNYYPANQVQVAITVNPAAPIVSVWPTAAAITVGQALSASTFTGGKASVSGTFAWTTPSATPAVGTDSESVTFTPTDATDYLSVTNDVSIVVNPAVPQFLSFTPRYTVCDTQCNFVKYTITAAGVEQGDIFHDATGLFTPDLTDSYPTGTTNFGITLQWQLPGTFQPGFDTWEGQHPNGPYGNQATIAFLGSGSQSTLRVSPTTGTLFQVEQKSGQIYWQKTDGTTGQFFSSIAADSPTQIAVDDVTAKVVRLITGTSTVFPQIDVNDESGDGGFSLCAVNPTGMSFVSSIAAMGGYMVFTDPVENLVGIAKTDCSGYKTISVAGQPWSVVMTNGTELDAYVLSRDKCVNTVPCLTKFGVPSGTIEGSVDLTGVTPVSTIRATTPYEGLYSVQAFNQTPTAAVVFMSDQTDGKVLIVSTATSGGAKMKVTYTKPITDLPIAIAGQETTSSSTLWVAYIAADTMDAITHVGAIDPMTGNYISDIGACQTGILAGGFIATSNSSGANVYCAQGSVIEPPLALQP